MSARNVNEAYANALEELAYIRSQGELCLVDTVHTFDLKYGQIDFTLKVSVQLPLLTDTWSDYVI